MSFHSLQRAHRKLVPVPDPDPPEVAVDLAAMTDTAPAPVPEPAPEITRLPNGTFAPGHKAHPKAGRPFKRRVVEVQPTNMSGCCWGFGDLDGLATADDHELQLIERATANSISMMLVGLESVLSEFVRVRFELARRNPDASQRIGAVITRLGNIVARSLNEAVADGAYGHRLSFLAFIPAMRDRVSDLHDLLGIPTGPPDALDAELAEILTEVEAEMAATASVKAAATRALSVSNTTTTTKET